MAYRTVTEAEFRERFAQRLTEAGALDCAGIVTGPGRSGAIASVYASHWLGVPWLPYGQPCPEKFRGQLLIVDTATWTGSTLRKAVRRYDALGFVCIYTEPPMVRFWYEDRAGNTHRRA